MKLPSIHTLLNPPPSPPTCNNNNNSNNNSDNNTKVQPPTVQILPASPTPSSTMDNVTLSPMLSPALSSTRSPSVSSVDPVSPMAMNSSEFPPIHGDDPPRRLVHSSSPSLQPRSPTHYLHHSHHHAPSSYHRRVSSSHSEPSSPSSYGYNTTKDHTIYASYPGANTLPTPPTTYHSVPSTPSIVVSESSSPSSSVAVVGASHDLLTPKHPYRENIHNNDSPSPSSASPSKEPAPAPPPCTQIFISPTGQPILKRRRGRPPTRSPGYDEGGWTFLSPTVWDVTSSSSSQQKQQQQQKEHQHGTIIDNDSNMTESMTAFTGADMDTVLPMPKKKRGRKPKTHIEGNSCFIWKDIGATARKSTTS